MGILADPLGLLRQYYSNEKPIIERNNMIYFGKMSWPRNVKTNFLMCRPSDELNIKQYYTLECLIFFLKNKDLPHDVYVREAVAVRIPAVRRPDREKLLAYLSGEIAFSASIDNSTHFKLKKSTGIFDALLTKGREEGRPAKRPRLEPYSRYDQEKFISRKELEGFEIDTKGTYQGMILKSIVEGSNFAKHSTKLNAISESPPAEKPSSHTPIIIIPDAATSIISMVNVKDILQDHKFVSVHQKKSEGAVHENEVLLHRKCDDNNTVQYRVVDDASRLTAAEWKRVVAVFVLGPSWQFKGWPNEGNPMQILANVCAFHLKFEDMKLDVRLTRWAVDVLTLSRTNRDLDRAELGRFWETLDKYMMKNKRHLYF